MRPGRAEQLGGKLGLTPKAGPPGGGGGCGGRGMAGENKVKQRGLCVGRTIQGSEQVRARMMLEMI